MSAALDTALSAVSEAGPEPAANDVVGHTPGSWFAASQNDILYVVAGEPPALNNDYPRHDAKRIPIAAIYEDAGYEAALSNAQLIARAPEMAAQLAALQAECALLRTAADEARILIGAKHENDTEVQKECNRNKAWWLLQNALAAQPVEGDDHG